MYTLRGCLVLFASAVGCAGCDTKGDLLDALRENDMHGKDQSALCLSPQLLGVDAIEAKDGKHYVAKVGTFNLNFFGSAVQTLDALREKGYAKREATSIPISWGNTGEAYEITEKGARYFQADSFSGQVNVCLGTKEPTEIVDYTEPPEGGTTQTLARFRYELELNDLVSDLGVEEALRKELTRDFPGSGMANLMKTNDGWVAQMVSWNP
jgi:hypothetical protein